ncbi:Hypothetical predicted protein [Mytilus galloprovincialis]|uniref:Uncharacterized protein n=1 Tax=Mytilus galloprovincialis TaxID=29158 RepID=A0A8B6F2U9_MYTGA|nr:Hypothetical predicted protein [Mytilus galloprovincialis]
MFLLYLFTAPKQFDIVECTDCSITVEWFSDVPDECLSYELNHQPLGTGDWSTEKFLSGEVSKQEDGRRMYTLQNLLPGINYELAIRSVYKDDVKSHISEPKTKQTLKLDECLSYELNHQPLGTGDWSTKEILAREVSKQEDGRRMYTLQNLLPGINYELAIRSVDKDDVKSHISEPKTKHTLKLAPKQFNIVECTDCSITVEWLSDVPDECLSYELNHQPLGTGDWSTKIILAGEVSKQEDGRRMYTLQNLLPGINYELTICSVYKDDVKSHISETKTKHTLKLAPKQFNIVECTDCFITVEWLNDVPDECLSYELNHKPLGTGDWSTKKILAEEVSKQEDGRRMYTLEHLQAGTCYELKIRSVYKGDVKGHFSESKTKQTFQVLQLSEEDKISYNKLMQTSKKEKRYFVRVMIVGKGSTGKTCLLRRLLKEDISDVTSTDGVDIVVRRCKINVQDGKWIIGKEIDDDKFSRIKRALNLHAEHKSTQKMQVDNTTNENISQSDEMPTDKKDKTADTNIGVEKSDKKESSFVVQEDLTNDAKGNSDKNKDTNESASMEVQEDLTTEANVNPDRNNDKTESASLEIQEDLTTDANVNPDRNKDTTESASLEIQEDLTNDAKGLVNNEKTNESESLAMPADLMSNVFSKSNENTLLNLYALCELWDFAGQKEFYATHQAFLTSSAVYLVVADMKDDISNLGLSQCFADFQNIGEYVDFWFDSIHCHRSADKLDSYGHYDPPILLVFTGKDRYDKEGFQKRENEIKNQLDKVFGLQSKYHHLHNTFYLSNTEDIDEVFEKLQNEVSEAARKINNWGNALPIKWILLEHLIDINKKDGKHFINFTQMSKLAKHHDINIQEEDDLLLFLRFQHSVGNIIFFENIRDLIILNPQWLADAFRCLVSDRVDNRRLYHLEDWTLFKRQGKISESLITELFKLKVGSHFSVQKNNLHKVMERLDILVKIKDSSNYIMPSMMPSDKFEDVCTNIGILAENCRRTSWLCFKFEFLPPSFFNHLSAWFITYYTPSQMDSDSGQVALYRGICIFDIDQSGCEKILVAMSTNTIALQVVSFSEQRKEFGSKCSDIYSEVKKLFEEIKTRYKVKIFFELHFKCKDGNYYKDTFRYQQLTNEQECLCVEHKKAHRSDLMYLPWIKKEVATSQRNYGVDPKPGTCPPGGGGTCAEHCSKDSDCQDVQKCCSNGCGHDCFFPVTVKSGTCPTLPPHTVGTCVDLCSVDSDCLGGQKCCSHGCGHSCSSPVSSCPSEPKCPNPPNGPPGTCKPQCIFEYKVINGLRCKVKCVIGPQGPQGPPCPPTGCPGAGIPEPPAQQGFSGALLGGERTKPGTCPVFPPGSGGTCVEKCRTDSDCPWKLKCCSSGCGHICQYPGPIPTCAPACDKPCPFGFVLDENNCPICECKTGSCPARLCPWGFALKDINLAKIAVRPVIVEGIDNIKKELHVLDISGIPCPQKPRCPLPNSPHPSCPGPCIYQNRILDGITCRVNCFRGLPPPPGRPGDPCPSTGCPGKPTGTAVQQDFPSNPPGTTPGNCPVGNPLTGFKCGLIPNRDKCPPGSFCNTEPMDRFGVCCLKRRCPVDPGPNSNCYGHYQRYCKKDSSCPKGKKCCKQGCFYKCIDAV